MKIGIIGSLKFLKGELDVDEYKSQIQEDYLLDFWNVIQDADAMVVLNYDKNGIKDYIGGSTLIGMSFAHVLGQTIYLMNPIPIVQSYFDEILHMKPIILNGDLTAYKSLPRVNSPAVIRLELSICNSKTCIKTFGLFVPTNNLS